MEVTEVLEFANYRMSEINKSLERLERQRDLLNHKEEELKHALAKWEVIVQQLASEAAAGDTQVVGDLSSMRLADACYQILKAKVHGLHARELVLELQNRGRTIGAKSPVDSVHKMLLRDRRFHRPGDRGTYWELEEWGMAAVEEIHKAV